MGRVVIRSKVSYCSFWGGVYAKKRTGFLSSTLLVTTEGIRAIVIIIFLKTLVVIG